tara:strand:+ start:24649 stop:25371 length:723 start_codon:yes stop_codon:yes gene_type:complete
MNKVAFAPIVKLNARTQGFTLLEVLLAIGITAMIGLGSWQILNSAIRASESTQIRLAELNALQKTMLIISRDLRQVLTRSIRDGFGDYQPALTTKNEFYALEFTRRGWRNPMDDARSNIQRVAYELSDNKLVRHYWSVLDRSQDSEPISKELLTEVNSISIRFMTKSGSWVDEWPSSSSSSSSTTAGGAATTDPLATYNELPKAVEISFDLQRFGKVKRLYDLPVYLENIDIPITTPNPP